MIKLAFLKKVKAKGRYYIYLREYKNMMGESDDQITIYRFGNSGKCIDIMENWIKNKDDIPLELKNRGINKEVIINWHAEINNIHYSS